MVIFKTLRFTFAGISNRIIEKNDEKKFAGSLERG